MGNILYNEVANLQLCCANRTYGFFKTTLSYFNFNNHSKNTFHVKLCHPLKYVLVLSFNIGEILKLLFPTKNQFKKWTMLSRVSYIAAAIGIPVTAIQLSLWAWGAYQWIQPAPQVLTAADKLLIDQNPTKLEIADVAIEKYDSKREMIVFKLKNPSRVTAKNVRVNFYNHNSEKSPYSEGIRYIDSGSGIDIPAGEIRSYRVAFKNDYENFFSPNFIDKKLLKVSTEIDSKNPFELNYVVCKNTSSCSFSSIINSTVVSIKYGSIFGQKYGLYAQFYNTFLDGKVNKS